MKLLRITAALLAGAFASAKKDVCVNTGIECKHGKCPNGDTCECDVGWGEEECDKEWCGDKAKRGCRNDGECVGKRNDPDGWECACLFPYDGDDCKKEQDLEMKIIVVSTRSTADRTVECEAAIGDLALLVEDNLDEFDEVTVFDVGDGECTHEGMDRMVTSGTVEVVGGSSGRSKKSSKSRSGRKYLRHLSSHSGSHSFSSSSDYTTSSWDDDELTKGVILEVSATARNAPDFVPNMHDLAHDLEDMDEDDFHDLPRLCHISIGDFESTDRHNIEDVVDMECVH